MPGTGWFGHREWEDGGAWVGVLVEALHVSRMLHGISRIGGVSMGVVRKGVYE